MHLLAAQSGVIDGGAQATDLNQTPADIVIISAADSELAALARAHDCLPAGRPSLRLANLMALGHNLSVDTYVEKTLRYARVIIVRVLGGRAYWTYGVDQLTTLARERGIKVAFLPGGDSADPELTALSTLGATECERLRQYFACGGPLGAGLLLRYAAYLLTGAGEPAPAKAMPGAGCYWPGKTETSFDDVRNRWRRDAPVAMITFYRALIEGGLTAPVDALVASLRARGINAAPVFVSSLKDAESAAVIARIFDAAPPAIVLNATGFATAAFGDAGAANPFSGADCPVLQVVFSGASRQAWLESAQGLPARDLAMNVVLPELDGRIMTRAVSFKADSEHHVATQCRIITYQSVQDRIDFTAQLAANWIALRQTPTARRKVVIVLANYPNRDGRIGNGVGYDTPASTLEILKVLQDAGYQVDEIPDDGNALIELL